MTGDARACTARRDDDGDDDGDDGDDGDDDDARDIAGINAPHVWRRSTTRGGGADARGRRVWWRRDGRRRDGDRARD